MSCFSFNTATHSTCIVLFIVITNWILKIVPYINNLYFYINDMALKYFLLFWNI